MGEANGVNFGKYFQVFLLAGALFSAANIAQIFVDSFNESVRESVAQQARMAKGGNKIRFTFCTFGAPQDHLRTRFVMLLVSAISLGAFIRINIGSVLAVVLAQLFGLYSFGSWFLRTYVTLAQIYRDGSPEKFDAPYRELYSAIPYRYLELSNTIDFAVLFTSIVSVVWGIAVIYHLTLERNANCPRLR